MTEFQFLENMAFYQRRFERLYFTIIRELNSYIRQNPVHDPAFYRMIERYSSLITLTCAWINLLKAFNSDKYTNIFKITDHYDSPTGVPDKVRPSDGRMPKKGPRAGAIKMTRYTNDPRRITAKFVSRCSKCDKRLVKGEDIYYWPSSREVFCTKCGEADYRRFLSDAADEDVYNGCGNPYAY